VTDLLRAHRKKNISKEFYIIFISCILCILYLVCNELYFIKNTRDFNDTV